MAAMAPLEAARDADVGLDSPHNDLNVPREVPALGFFGALFCALILHVPAGKARQILGA